MTAAVPHCDKHCHSAQIVEGQRFGFHNLHHSLSNSAKVKSSRRRSKESCVIQEFKRPSIPTCKGDSDETRAAQGEFLKGLGVPSGAVQRNCGLRFFRVFDANSMLTAVPSAAFAQKTLTLQQNMAEQRKQHIVPGKQLKGEGPQLRVLRGCSNHGNIDG